MSNTLTGLIPTIYTALDTVSREQVGFIPAVSRNAKADAAAKGTSVTAPVAPAATTVDIEPGATAPNDGDQTIDSVEVKITKSKMAPVKWNGEEQLALGPAGTYNTILADQFKQAFRALSNEVDADLGALYYATSRAVGKAGTTPFGVAGDLSDAANARQVMSDNGSPTTDLQMVLGSSAIANLRGKQSVLFKVNESGTDALLREGVIGRLEGFNIHESAGVKKHASVATGYLVNGEKKEGDILIAVDTGTGAFKAGDIVTFAGDVHQYVVAAATASTITLTMGNERITFSLATFAADIGVASIARGCQVGAMQLETPADGDVTVSITFAGLGFDSRGDGTKYHTEPVDNAGKLRYSFKTVTNLKLNGIQGGNGFCVDSFSLNFDNNMQVQRCIGTGTPFAGANIPTTFTPSGSVTLSWSKAAWEIWKKTLTGETIPFEFTLQNAEGGYTFLFPAVQVDGDWPDGGNTDIIQVQLNITAADTPPTITRIPPVKADGK